MILYKNYTYVSIYIYTLYIKLKNLIRLLLILLINFDSYYYFNIL